MRSMFSFEKESAIEASLEDGTRIIFQELDDDRESLEQQRRHIADQRVLLDLELAELEQQRQAIQLAYALLDARAEQLNQYEVMLASEYEAVRMTGKSGKWRRSE